MSEITARGPVMERQGRAEWWQQPASFWKPTPEPPRPPFAAAAADSHPSPPQRRRPALPSGYEPPDYLVAPVKLADGRVLHINAPDLADPRYVNVRNLNPDGTPVEGRAGLQPREVFEGATLMGEPYYGTTYKPPTASQPAQAGQVVRSSSQSTEAVHPPLLSHNQKHVEAPPARQQSPPPVAQIERPAVDSKQQTVPPAYTPYWKVLEELTPTHRLTLPPAEEDHAIEHSPRDTVQTGQAEGASPAEIAERLQLQRDRLFAHHARPYAQDRYGRAAARIDHDVDAELAPLFQQHLQRHLAELLPRLEDQEELLRELDSTDDDLSSVSPRFAGLAQRLRDIAAQSSPLFSVPRPRETGRIPAAGGPLAAYSTRETRDRTYVHLTSYKKGTEPVLFNVPRVTHQDVATEVEKAKSSAKTAQDGLTRLSQIGYSPLEGIHSGIAYDLMRYRTQIAEAETRVRQLSGPGAIERLTSERILTEVRKPEYRYKLGAYGGWEEVSKGILDSILSTGAAVARASGNEPWLQEITQAQGELDTVLPGSTRRELEGGAWNNAVRTAQRGAGSALPYAIGGGALGARGISTSRFGVAGLGGGAAAAGQSLIATGQQIREAEDLVRREPHNTQAADHLHKLRTGRDLHAMFSGALATAASGLSPLQNFTKSSGGLAGVARQAVINTAEAPLQGIAQHGLIDPLRGDSADPLGNFIPDLSAGALSSAALAGLGVVLPHSKGRNSTGDFAPATPARPLISGSRLEQWADQTIAISKRRFNTGLDPEVAGAMAIKGAALLEKGVTTVNDWAGAMVRQHGPSIQPHLSEVFAESLRISQGGRLHTDTQTFQSQVEELHNWPPEGREFLPGEGLVGRTSFLRDSSPPKDNIAPHHTPSRKHMEHHGVSKNDGFAINMEHINPGRGGRHRQTFTYGRAKDEFFPPRDALSAGIRDVRRVYQNDGLYGAFIRQQLRELIRLQKQHYNRIFKKCPSNDS